jgi:hypothetical protein
MNSIGKIDVRSFIQFKKETWMKFNEQFEKERTEFTRQQSSSRSGYSCKYDPEASALGSTGLFKS